jgi:hypothetical protein
VPLESVIGLFLVTNIEKGIFNNVSKINLSLWKPIGL